MEGRMSPQLVWSSHFSLHYTGCDLGDSGALQLVVLKSLPRQGQAALQMRKWVHLGSGGVPCFVVA